MLAGKYLYHVNKFDDLITFLIVWKTPFSHHNLRILSPHPPRVIFVSKCCFEGALRVHASSIDETSHQLHPPLPSVTTKYRIKLTETVTCKPDS